MRLVVDTNVLVSSLWKPGSVPARALAAIWATNGVVLHDARIMAEYRQVLGRPKFDFEPASVEALLGHIAERGRDFGAVPPWSGELSDEGDRIFVELAIAAKVDAVVTGNIKHYPLGLGFDVLPPATMLAQLGVGDP